MKSQSLHKLLLTAAALSLASTPSLSRSKDDFQIPKTPDTGKPFQSDLPPLGDVSGIGKGPGGVSPAKIVQTIKSARADRTDSLRGRKQRNDLDKLGRSTVLVVTPTKLGTATLVDKDGTFVTSWHIVKDQTEVGVIYMPQDREHRPTEADAVQAFVIRTNQTTDLALLNVAKLSKAVKPMELSSPDRARPGGKLRIVGHPYGEIWTLAEGAIQAITPIHSWKSADGTRHQAEVIQFQSNSITANAGGPVIDKQNKLLAVDTFRTDHKTLTSIGVSATEVKRLLMTPTPSAPASPSKPRSAKQCPPVRLSTNRTRNEDGTIHTLDLNCNGKADAMMLIPDDPKAGNHLANDANENGTTDSVYFDFDRDGKFDEVRFDTNEDGKADLVGTDLDQQLVPRSSRLLK